MEVANLRRAESRGSVMATKCCGEIFAAAGGLERVGRDQRLRERFRRAARFGNRDKARGLEIGGFKRPLIGDGIGIVEEVDLGLACNSKVLERLSAEA